MHALNIAWPDYSLFGNVRCMWGETAVVVLQNNAWLGVVVIKHLWRESK